MHFATLPSKPFQPPPLQQECFPGSRAFLQRRLLFSSFKCLGDVRTGVANTLRPLEGSGSTVSFSCGSIFPEIPTLQRQPPSPLYF